MIPRLNLGPQVPLLTASFFAELRARGFAGDLTLAEARTVNRLTEAERLTRVLVVQDAVTSHYDLPVLVALLHLHIELGSRPWLAPCRPNGKPLHIPSFLGRFVQPAASIAGDLFRLAAAGIASSAWIRR